MENEYNYDLLSDWAEDQLWEDTVEEYLENEDNVVEEDYCEDTE